jgi:tRNA G10  N-methylase Trm11
MNYKYFQNTGYEDLACGRVIYHKASYPTYPARLAGEIFMRCYKHLGLNSKPISVYDPCCGGAYMLTVLGFLCGVKIKSIYASDISNDAIVLARNNLSLLTLEGLQKRKIQIAQMYQQFNKLSHKEALVSIENLKDINNQRNRDIDATIFKCNIFNRDDLLKQSLKADLVITDVPYGNLVNWSGGSDDAINKMLDTLNCVLSNNAMIAISSDKKQKISNKSYLRVEKILIGKRKIELLRKL